MCSGLEPEPRQRRHACLTYAVILGSGSRPEHERASRLKPIRGLKEPIGWSG